jgi:hypothetical protein
VEGVLRKACDNEPFHEWGEGTDEDHVIKRKDEPAARHMVQHRRDYDIESYLFKRRPNQPWIKVE